MVHFTLESIETLPIREVTLCSKTDGIDQIPRVRRPAVLGLNIPFMSLGVELSPDDSSVERYVFLNIQLPLHMSKVLPELVVSRVFLCPCPVFPYLWQRVLVDWDRGIDTSTRVAVPERMINIPLDPSTLATSDQMTYQCQMPPSSFPAS